MSYYTIFCHRNEDLPFRLVALVNLAGQLGLVDPTIKTNISAFAEFFLVLADIRLIPRVPPSRRTPKSRSEGLEKP